MTAWIFPDLYRPQYPPTPDVLQSALAWSFFKPASSQQTRGYIYFRQSSSQPKRITIVNTRPDVVNATLWSSALRAQQLLFDGSPHESEVAHATAEALVGIEPEKGTGLTAAPLGPAAALLQDPSGAMGVENPPNFAALINQLFLLGSMSGHLPHPPAKLASELWYRAVRKIATQGALLSAVDSALFEGVVKTNIVSDGITSWPPVQVTPSNLSIPANPPAWWIDASFDATDTPFGWFADAWTTLCSDPWIEALPPRRWTDWASCLLRQALAFCFLWEANFFAVLGRYVVTKHADSLESTLAQIKAPAMGLIPWATTGSISTLDIKPQMRDLLRMGHACRSAFWKWQKTAAAPKEKTLEAVFKHARKRASSTLRADLIDALDGSAKAGGLSNLIETVEYSLLCRRDTGRSADFYGLTRTVSRRFTHVAPSPEWIVVISSVAAPGPNAGCRLADVLESLRRLGLQPRIDTLVRELERAGLCASAPDGDEGILVSPAFGG